jgi:hypothetical protein
LDLCLSINFLKELDLKRQKLIFGQKEETLRGEEVIGIVC